MVEAAPAADPGPPVPEPVDLHHRARRLAAEFPAEARLLLAAGEWIGGRLWDEAGPALKEAGVTRDDVIRHAGSCARELWLWVMGERTWEEASALVVGGARRRAQARAAGEARPTPASPRPLPGGSG